MLRRLGSLCARHGWGVVAAWVAALVVLWAAAIAFGGQADNSFSLPGAESQEALDLLADEFPVADAADATLVFHATGASAKVTDSDLESSIESVVSDTEDLDDVARVISPFQQSSLVSSNGRTALAQVFYDAPTQDLPDEGQTAFDQLAALADRSTTSSLRVEAGGQLGAQQPIPLEGVLVLYGLLAALLVLLIALGTWWSFAWPVVGAIVGVGAGEAVIRLLERYETVPSISDTVAVMIGLGVGIDYGLFVMGRIKELEGEGLAPPDAAATALATAGRSVVTAGATVVVALVGLVIFEVPALNAVTGAVVVVVLCVIAAAATLQPAIAGIVGTRLTRGHAPLAMRSAEPKAAARWAGLVSRRAWLFLPAGLAVLLALAIPVFKGDLRLGPLDSSLYPTDSTQFRAFELQTAAFGPGSATPFLVVVEIPSSASSDDVKSELEKIGKAIADTKGVASVTPAVKNSSGSLAVIQTVPTTGPNDEATAELVTRLRDSTIPQATSGTDFDALVSGVNAVFVDLDDRIGDRLPLFILVVCLIAIVILGFVFRSLLIPIKAALFDLVTILATYGVVVMIFTYGWGRTLFDVRFDLPILSILAPVFFAILFGLSNDYEVYLVGRMEEELDGGADPVRAARLGHGRGTRTVLAAALIMILVFASYAFQPGAAVVQFGVGMAAAILLDAFVTRMVMLPATMRLGRGAMWWPGRSAGTATSPTGSEVAPVAGD